MRRSRIRKTPRRKLGGAERRVGLEGGVGVVGAVPGGSARGARLPAEPGDCAHDADHAGAAVRGGADGRGVEEEGGVEVPELAGVGELGAGGGGGGGGEGHGEQRRGGGDDPSLDQVVGVARDVLVGVAGGGLDDGEDLGGGEALQGGALAAGKDMVPGLDAMRVLDDRLVDQLAQTDRHARPTLIKFSRWNK